MRKLFATKKFVSEKKVALVTGREASCRFARRGVARGCSYSMPCITGGLKRANDTASQLASRFKMQAIFAELATSFVKRMVKEVRCFGRIDALVNSAAI